MFKKLLCILAALFAAQSACACGFDSMLPLSAEAHPHSPSNTKSMFARSYWRLEQRGIDVRGSAAPRPPLGTNSHWQKRQQGNRPLARPILKLCGDLQTVGTTAPRLRDPP